MIVVGLAALATPLSPVLADDPVITFPDAKLDVAIREAIGKPTGHIYQSDLEGLTSLNASRKSISDITGLEYCVNITTLDLNLNCISDISPLSSLTNLTTLHLRGVVLRPVLEGPVLLHIQVQMSDISPLSPLTNLIRVRLCANGLSDISPLSSLTNLTTLYLSCNRISNISPLTSLTNLTMLRLSRNRISDISPLADNIGLDEGDTVHLLYNCLDITADSQARNDIQTLQDRGVSVSYSRQKKIPLMPLLIGGIIAAVVAGGLAIFFVRRRRPA